MLLVYNLHHYYVSRLRFGFYLFPQQDSNLHSLESKSSVLTNYTMEKYLRGRRGTRTHKSISRPTCFQDKLLIQPVAFLIAVIVGLEPTTLMLTASCSTIELYDLVSVWDLFRLLPRSTPYRTLIEGTAIPVRVHFTT